jgi:hypothetical protein
MGVRRKSWLALLVSVSGGMALRLALQGASGAISTAVWSEFLSVIAIQPSYNYNLGMSVGLSLSHLSSFCMLSITPCTDCVAMLSSNAQSNCGLTAFAMRFGATLVLEITTSSPASLCLHHPSLQPNSGTDYWPQYPAASPPTEADQPALRTPPSR